jgi:quercetin dioxygenase-like cupin family protein
VPGHVGSTDATLTSSVQHLAQISSRLDTGPGELKQHKNEAPPMEVQPQLGIRRTDLQQQKLSVPGRQLIQARVEFDEGYVAPNHTHFGEEIIYVLEGNLEYDIEGQAPMTYRAGEALTVPAGAKHAVRNLGPGTGAELATYVVEIDKPLITLVP